MQREHLTILHVIFLILMATLITKQLSEQYYMIHKDCQPHTNYIRIVLYKCGGLNCLNNWYVQLIIIPIVTCASEEAFVPFKT